MPGWPQENADPPHKSLAVDLSPLRPNFTASDKASELPIKLSIQGQGKQTNSVFTMTVPGLHLHAKTDRKTKLVANKWNAVLVDPLHTPCRSGCGHLQEECLSAIREDFLCRRPWGLHPARKAHWPPTLRQEDQLHAHWAYFPSHHVTPTPRPH